MSRTFDPQRTAREVMARLRAGADEERRSHAAGYCPTAMEILGVSVPVMRPVAKKFARALRTQPASDIIDVARALIDTGTHEGRQTAYEIIDARREVAPLMDAALIRELGRGNDNWASVDAFAVLVAGPAWRDGRITDAEVMRWARSADVWWRRTALAATVVLNTRSRGGRGDAPRTLRICEVLVADQHPMIVKALSWALRQLVAFDAAAVRAFLATHDVAPRVRREVETKLNTGTKSGRGVLRDATS